MEYSMPVSESQNLPIQLARNFSFIIQSWTAFASALPLSLTSGGPTSIIWGLLSSTICTLCIAYSLAEFLSAYPTAAGQYHWVAVSWETPKLFLSWLTGWFNVAAWICLTATASLFGSQLVMNVVVLVHPSFNVQRWQLFLVYISSITLAFLVNAFWNSVLAALNKIALLLSICGFLLILVVALACATPDYNSASFVFTDFINKSGWNDGVAWLLGLLQGSLCLIGFHGTKEIPNPSVQGPRVMVACVAIGAFTSFVLVTALLFVARDINTVISSAYGPLLQILLDATQSKAGAICLLIFPIVCLVLGVTGIMTTSSRMIYALGRDNGLPLSPTWTKVHTSLQTPLNALGLSWILAVCLGCIYLGSMTAFNGVSSATVICFDLSYLFPILIHCLRGRAQLPSRAYVLSPIVGWSVNIVAIIYILLTTVFFILPPNLPVTGENMNYAIAVVGVLVVFSTIYWFLRGRKKFVLASASSSTVHAHSEDMALSVPVEK
ncbi:amino acid/polyamine transporter I [Aspergillus falconensis]